MEAIDGKGKRGKRQVLFGISFSPGAKGFASRQSDSVIVFDDVKVMRVSSSLKPSYSWFEDNQKDRIDN